MPQSSATSHHNFASSQGRMNPFLLSSLILAGLVGSNQAFTALSPNTLPPQARSRDASSPTQLLSWNRKLRVIYSDPLLNDDLRNDVSGGKKKNGRRWPGKLWSHITRRNPPVRSSPAPLRMLSVDEETEALLESITKHYNDDFILRNFEEQSPDAILPQVEQPGIDSEYYDVSITRSASSIPETRPSQKTRHATIPRIGGLIGRLLQNVLTGIIVRNAAETPEGLTIQAFPRGNILARLVRGTISADARIDAGRLVFPAIRMSSGSLEIKRMTLNVMGFLPNQRSSSASRYPKQFDLHADDLTFSRDDLLGSPCIRNGLQNLLVRILKDRGVKSSTIRVSSLDILPSGKISVKGEAKTLFDSPLSFEVRTGISTASRGHVLTFPGLEVSLNRDLGLFVPVVPVIDLDIGHNARLRKVDIDGKQKHLRLSASVTITPKSTIRLGDYVQTSAAFSARFSYDVGQWLTELGNFTR